MWTGRPIVLLPIDPDASAEALRAGIRERSNVDVAVIVSDTMGRPWRLGQTDVAIGAAGIGAVRDYRGEADAYGNKLEVTQIAVIDELAAAADLVKGKADQVPVAVIRGFARHPSAPPQGPARWCGRRTRTCSRWGRPKRAPTGCGPPPTLPDEVAFADADLPAGAVDRALSTVEMPVEVLTAARVHSTTVTVPPYSRMILKPGGDPRRPARAGADVHRLRAALAAEGLATTWLDDGTPLGLLAVGTPA